MKNRKIAIIGVGHVGAHCAYTLALQGLVDELVLVDKDHKKALSEQQDIRDAIMYCPHRVSVSIADYDELEDVDIIVNAVGKVEILTSHNRVDELNLNIANVNDYIPKVMKGGFHGIIINISNPCDIITRQIAKLSGLPEGHVFGTGTGLDTSRLISALALQIGVSHSSIAGFMMGEHGAAQIVPWSQVTISGKSLDTMDPNDSRVNFDRDEMQKKVIGGGWVTFDGKKCTEYGIAATLARDVRVVVNDEHAIIPVSTELHGEYGVNNVFVGVPAIVGRNGVEEILEYDLTPEELKKFQACCEGVRENMKLNKDVIPE